MKNIKEKAEEYLEQNKDEILCVYDRYAGFDDDANYVLEQIESCYDKNDSLCVIAHKILSKIQELKGE